MTSSSDRAVLLVVAVLVAVALWLRWSDDDAGSGPGDDENVLPLLGTEGEPPRRAALAVKIDNTDTGVPSPASTRPTWWSKRSSRAG